MPLGRYFVYIGGVLLALLFLIDWHLPPPVADSARAGVDRSIIRIQSLQKWPSAVVFDTSQPTIVPPPPDVTAEAPPPPKSPREAFAFAPPPDPVPVAAAPAAPVRHVARRTRVARAPEPRIASFEMFGFRNAFPAGW